MSQEFRILKARPKIPVVMTRDSVCAGDDCDAPHEKKMEVTSFLDPAAFTKALATGYLASVAGIGHSWSCMLNGVKIAEVRHSGIHPCVAETPFSDENQVHFIYHSATF